MSILYVFFAIALGGLIFFALQKKGSANEKFQLAAIRVSIYGLIGLLLTFYLLVECEIQEFKQLWYLPMLTLLTFAELALYSSLMKPGKVDGSLSAAGKKRRESRRTATSFLLVFLLGVSIWILVGYFFPGSWGTLST